MVNDISDSVVFRIAAVPIVKDVLLRMLMALESADVRVLLQKT